ncbi:MAG: hypothetical protein CM1200mP10_07110 [Candidatus Neomarinimicrobiota bacterium]|nr:MAG: hypothetical protein CM1200mP10_07110 [Candidatus Neomarinimicrobiota bacterium]
MNRKISTQWINLSKQRDYFKSGINICIGEGLVFSNGFECEITSKIPIQAGVGSSSAVMVNWIHFLSQMADTPVIWNAQKIGELAYKAEVWSLMTRRYDGPVFHQYGAPTLFSIEPDISIKSLNPIWGLSY